MTKNTAQKTFKPIFLLLLTLVWGYVFLSWSAGKNSATSASPTISQTTSTDSCRERDSLALVALYNAMDGENWTNTWDLSGPMNEWHGVYLNEAGCVSKIISLTNNLHGSLPNDLGKLLDLESLWINNNRLKDSIPSSLGNLTKLKSLILTKNSLTGQIPESFKSLKKLETLSLYINNLSGEIPRSLGRLDNLRSLNLNNNKLDGNIPVELGLLDNLISLDLSRNDLSGEIPAELGNLVKLDYLNLRSNQLSGNIPPELGNLSKLQTIWLLSNSMSGEIPHEFGKLSELKFVYLGENNLTGSIPESIFNCRNLITLDLRGNNLNGQLSDRVGNLTKLEGLHLQRNDLNGKIPNNLGQLLALKTIDLWNNNLIGQIPKELGNLKLLKYIGFSFNSITGTIPPELGKLSNLEHLGLGNNKISGDVPIELMNLRNLEVLALGENQLTGKIPRAIVQLKNVEYLNLSNNNFTGNLWQEFGHLNNLSRIWLDNNQFEGLVPTELNRLAKLETFSICPGNHFIGPIPTFPNSPNLDVSNIDFSCITGARVQGKVNAGLNSQRADCDYLDPVNNIKIYYNDTYLGLAHENFDFSILEGDYKITAIPSYPELYRLICPDSGFYQINIASLSDTVQDLNFVFEHVDDCPLLQVSIEAARQRWCADNTMELHYQNVGTSSGDSAWIELALPSYISIINASIPFNLEDGNSYRFELGRVHTNSSGTIKITNHISCDAPIGTTICIDANIYPQFQCREVYADTNIPINISGVCMEDSIVFTLQNTSHQSISSSYRLIEDFSLIDSVSFSLEGQSSLDVVIPADRHTYVLMIEDGDGNANNNPWTGVEQCGDGPFTQGLLGQFPTQGNLHKNRLCRLLRGSFDPNDKLADPPGGGPDHHHLPNTDIKYTIRFQNTGNDTAFAVVLLDTIDTLAFDLNSILPDASSHPYHFQIKDGNVVEFSLYPIALPDSTTNPEGSQGYVSFTIAQKRDLPQNTRLENRAAIYFDNNPAVITNTYFHTIHTPQRKQTTDFAEFKNQDEVIIYPNPSSGLVNIQSDLRIDKVEVFDVMGRKVMETDQKRFHLNTQGVYLLQLNMGKSKISKKVMIH